MPADVMSGTIMTLCWAHHGILDHACSLLEVVLDAGPSRLLGLFENHCNHDPGIAKSVRIGHGNRVESHGKLWAWEWEA